MNFTWFHSADHIILLAILFMLYLAIKGLDRLHDLLDSFHDDFRKVNDLDLREKLEFQSKMDADIERHMKNRESN